MNEFTISSSSSNKNDAPFVIPFDVKRDVLPDACIYVLISGKIISFPLITKSSVFASFIAFFIASFNSSYSFLFSIPGSNEMNFLISSFSCSKFARNFIILGEALSISSILILFIGALIKIAYFISSGKSMPRVNEP